MKAKNAADFVHPALLHLQGTFNNVHFQARKSTRKVRLFKARVRGVGLYGRKRVEWL